MNYLRTKYEFNFEGQNIEIIGRSEVQSDRDIIGMVFGSKMFSTDRFQRHNAKLQNLYNSIIEGNLTPVIIDAGANIGAASRFFSVMYPASRIYSYEPDVENHQLCSLNMTGCNSETILGALSKEDGFLYLNTIDYGPIAYRTGSSGNIKVRSYSLMGILDAFPSTEKMFILKIDVEGAESEIFSMPVLNINTVPLIIIELHDWMLPFEGVSRNFFREISRENFDILFFGENLFCFNNNILANY